MYCSGCRVVWPVFGAFCCISFQGMPLLRFVASCVFGEIKFFSFRKTRFGVRREADWSFLFSPFRYYIFSLLNPKWKQSIEQHYLRSQVTRNAEVYHIYREANHVPSEIPGSGVLLWANHNSARTPRFHRPSNKLRRSCKPSYTFR